jgi:hypothetical protein
MLLKAGDETMKSTKYLLACAGVLLSLAVAAYGQETTSVTLSNQTITVKSSGVPTGNRVAGTIHTDANLAFKGFSIPKGDYSIYVLTEGVRWQLAVSRATIANAATYDPKQDLGRVSMLMVRPQGPPASCKMTLSKIAPLAAQLQVVCNDKAATAAFRLDRGANDSEW